MIRDSESAAQPLPVAAHLPHAMPFAYQLAHGNTNDCGPYSLTMALSYWGREPFQALGIDTSNIGGDWTKQGVDITDLAVQVARNMPWRVPTTFPFGDRFGGATPPIAMIAMARRAGMQLAAHPNSTLVDLKQAIAAGHPVIVLVQPAGSVGLVRHYRVLVGYEEGHPTRYYYNDPGYQVAAADRTEPGNSAIDEPVFLQEWSQGGFGPFWQYWCMTVWK